MNTSVQIIEDVFEPDRSETLQGSDVLSVLQARFDVFPETARLYFGQVSLTTDVTPKCEEDVERLKKQPGHYIVVIYPGELFSSLIYLIIAAVAVAVVAAVLLKPKLPNAASRNINNESANNALANRTNEARPKARIPDIFGQVRAYPDLVQLPYSVWIDNSQTEFSIMCLGRGEYQIHDVRETDTEVSQIPGTKISIWDPNHDILIDFAQYQYGPADFIYDHIWQVHGAAIVKRVNSVDGQTLTASNAASYRGNRNLTFTSDGHILAPTGEAFGTRFEEGKSLTISDISWDDGGGLEVTLRPLRRPTDLPPPPYWYGFEVVAGGGAEAYNLPTGTRIRISDSFSYNSNTYNLSGIYTITRYLDRQGDDEILYWIMQDATTVNPNWTSITGLGYAKPVNVPYGAAAEEHDWNFLQGTFELLISQDRDLTLDVGGAWAAVPPGGVAKLSATITASIDTEGGGPFTVLGRGVRGFAFNFFAQSMYKDDGKNQIATSVTCEGRVECYDDANELIAAFVGTVDVVGNATDTNSKGSTLYIDVPPAAYFSVSARRLTPKDTEFEGQVVDEVKWRDLYAVTPNLNGNFGNVTIIRAQSRATESALTGKERKLNLLVTRKVNKRLPDGSFDPELQPSRYIPDIFVFAARDPYIGNRQDYELDIDQIYDIAQFAENYFGFEQMLEFCYTFDNTGITFEETAQMIANAGLLTAYRRGQLIRLEFEYRDSPSRLLFNHRNKIPGSETRTYQFINDNQYDGVEYTWVDPQDDSLATIYLPNDLAINPRKVESVGIRNERQARIQASRVWNRIRYRAWVLEFEGLAEAETIIPPNCIAVSNNTRSETKDGYVDDQVGLQLTLSQSHVFDPAKSYVMQLQMGDGTIEVKAITPHPTLSNVVTLASPTTFPILTDMDAVTQTMYNIIEVGEDDVHKYIVTEREASNSDSNTHKVLADNYDERYYANDKDYAPSEEEEWLKSLGDLVLWLDGAYQETITDSSGVVLWQDKSDYSNDGAQPLVAHRPTVADDIYQPRAVNFGE